jgi:hypothetical protein
LELDPPEISPNLQRGIASLQTTYNEELIPWADGLVPGWNFSDLRTYYQVHRALPDFFLYKLNHRHTERILELLRIDAEWPKERP